MPLSKHRHHPSFPVSRTDQSRSLSVHQHLHHHHRQQVSHHTGTGCRMQKYGYTRHCQSEVSLLLIDAKMETAL